MLALGAFIAFLIAFILYLVDRTNDWILGLELLGLLLLSAQIAFGDWAPLRWRGRA